CFWLGASDPHRGYEKGSGQSSGMDPAGINLFDHFPDSPVIRNDVADYYFEVQRFDQDVGSFVSRLEELGVLANTLIVVTGDHGMPFPRCKANLYDSGARVPLAIQWPARIKAGRGVKDFVSTTDLAPTFLEAAGVAVPEAMTGRSLLKLFARSESDPIEAGRDHVLMGKERHVPGQEGTNLGGTPMRAIRTHDHLLIHNHHPDRWPAGTPNHEKAAFKGAWIADCDNGPTKTYMVQFRDKDDDHRLKYDLAFGRRPAFELYDLKKDPGQLNNVAALPAYETIRKNLFNRLKNGLKATGDPRMNGKGDAFDRYPYFGGGPKFPGF
ncbi:MAG: sulfatase/phosphatase domain-containing protein, partial [Verrucomicrobiota bacterium]